MRKRWNFVLTTCTVMGVVLGAAGCSPSYQPPTQPTDQAKVLSQNGAQAIMNAVQLGLAARMYKVKSDVKLIQGSLHTDFSAYGSVNAPDLASISFHANNFNVSFYQQGQAAYELENGHWQPSAPISNIDVFPSYQQVARTIQQESLPVYQEKDQFIVDEYCHVYDVTVPNQGINHFGVVSFGMKLPNMSAVEYTFYIGTKDHELREVQTNAVGTVGPMGAVQISSETDLFDLGNQIAAVKIPNDLVIQLKGEGKTS